MECQHDSAAHILHCDPADLLIPVAALIDLTAVIRSQEVGTGNGCRQIGIDLNQLICAVAVLEAQKIFLRLDCFHLPACAIKSKGVVGI